jgi:hypothetical protein
MRLPGIGSHHSAVCGSDEWLTPPEILRALGPFDLDPCAPVNRPWDTAAKHLTVEDDGLDHPWEGRVWLNCPYSEVEKWMRRMADHNYGVALVFARTDTRWWFETIWLTATALLFLRGRVTFYRVDGEASKAGHNSGGPSVLVAYGAANARSLKESGIDGRYVDLTDRTL